MINHLTINTGHSRVIKDGEVTKETIKILKPWIKKGLEGEAIPLPVEPLAHISAKLLPTEGGGLVVTVYAPAAPHEQGKPFKGKNVMPLVTFGVAKNTKQGDELWQSFAKIVELPDQPQTPWVSVILHESLPLYIADTSWLGDFERSVAVSFLTDGRSVAPPKKGVGRKKKPSTPLNLKLPSDVVAHVKEQPNKNGYIVGLIRADMKARPRRYDD